MIAKGNPVFLQEDDVQRKQSETETGTRKQDTRTQNQIPTPRCDKLIEAEIRFLRGVNLQSQDDVLADCLDILSSFGAQWRKLTATKNSQPEPNKG